MNYTNTIKPFFDILFALIALIITFPLMVVISVFLFLDFGKSIFFIQTRVGKKEKIFKLIKFRTMKGTYSGDISQDKNRVTKIGKLLRKTSLDELPQLINVLKGELSFVGPRPLLVEYLPYYSEEQKKRHLVQSGITGWAQVNGRNAIDWEKRLKLDVEYLEKQSFWFDLKILMMTFRAIFNTKNTDFPLGNKIKFSDFVKQKHQLD